MNHRLFISFLVFILIESMSFAQPLPEELAHPYLFFSKKDLPAIRGRMKNEPFSTRWQIFLENANRVLQTAPHHYNPQNGDVGNSRKHLENAGKTAFAYIITGEKKYAERAIGEAMSMVNGFIPHGNQWVWYNPEFRNWNKGADLSTAEMCYGLAMVYDWCFDVLNEQQKEAIKQTLVEKGIRHYLHSIEIENQDFWVGNPTSNWAGVVNGGVGLGALAIYAESDIARKAIDYARKYVPEFLNHVFLKDGGGHEGVMYARYGELFSLYFLMASQRLFGVDHDLWNNFHQKLTGYWDVYMQAPDQKYANFNNIGEHTFQGLWDKNNSGGGGPSSDINALMELLVPGGDKLLLWAADNGAPRFTWSGASPWYFLWRRPDVGRIPADKKPQLQQAVLFREAGHAILRSEKMWLAYNSGWISDRSHNNRDLGSFIFVLNNERMVHDPGYGDGDASQHSTIIINGEDQIRGKSGKYLHFDSRQGFHYLATDLTNAYNQEYLNKFIRHVLMVKDRYIVLLDEVTLKKQASVEWRLQTRKKAHLMGNEAIIRGENQQLRILNAADPANISIKDMKGKNGAWQAICKSPKESRLENLLVTVLMPSHFTNKATVNFQNGMLTIKNGEEVDEIIGFSKKKDRWQLVSFNQQDVLPLADGSERSLKPFRKTKTESINWQELPPWFFPINNQSSN